jgi:glycosyltransferase involved in cell wall biosynthesis
MTNPHTEISDFERLPKAPRVSVIVMAYNHAPYLEQAVESVARQRTTFDYEILIGEDCSQDGTREVARQLQARYPDQVRLFYSPHNRGMVGNFRFLLGHCRGDYIGGCEGDDFWIDEEKLERQVSALDRLPGVDMGFTRGYQLFRDGSRVPGWDYGESPRVIAPGELFRGLAFIAPAASVVMRAHVLKGLPEWLDEAPNGDIFHYLAGASRGGASYLPEYTVCYRIAQPTSFTVVHERRSHAERIAFFEALLHYIDRTCAHYGVPRKIVSNRVNDFRLQIVIHSLADRKYLQAAAHFLRLDGVFVLRGVGRRLGRLLGRSGDE